MNAINLSLPAWRAKRWFAATAIAGSLALLAGCANDTASSSVYSYGQAQREQIVRTGTIVGMRPVVIQNDGSSGVGMVAGGVLGGVAGSTIGRGGGNALATVGGAILGGILGNTVENQSGRIQGVEITVRLDNGETRVVAQADDTPLSPGQRVRMISGNGPTRVVPM